MPSLLALLKVPQTPRFTEEDFQNFKNAMQKNMNYMTSDTIYGRKCIVQKSLVLSLNNWNFQVMKNWKVVGSSGSFFDTLIIVRSP